MGHGKNSRSLPWATSAGPALLRLEEETLVDSLLLSLISTEELVLARWMLSQHMPDLLQMGHSMGSLNGAVWPSSQHSSQVPSDKGESFK